jgi:hypothetical protein
MLLKSTQGNLALVNLVANDTAENDDIQAAFSQFVSIKQMAVLSKSLTPELFNGYNFMLISYHTWNDVSEHHKKALQRMPSTLILSR